MENPPCPECGKEMKIGAYQGSSPLYNCDNCGIDCWRPPKKVVKPPEPETKPEPEPEKKSEEKIPELYSGEPDEPEKKTGETPPKSSKRKKKR